MSRFAEITGWGKCMPPAIMTNDDMTTVIDTSDEWIRSRSGIEERRVSHVPGSELAAVAGHRALAAAGTAPEEIDLLIVATCTPDTVIPSTAAHVQKKMGAKNAAVFDLNAGCSGFLYSLAVATSMIRSAGYRKALVIGSERITWFLNWSLRDTAVLFGDGAGAHLSWSPVRRNPACWLHTSVAKAKCSKHWRFPILALRATVLLMITPNSTSNSMGVKFFGAQSRA